MTNSQSIKKLTKIFFEQCWAEDAIGGRSIMTQLGITKEETFERSKKRVWITEKEAEKQLHEIIMDFFPKDARSVLEEVIKGFKKELVESGYDENYLTVDEIIMANEIRRARPYYIKLVKKHGKKKLQKVGLTFEYYMADAYVHESRMPKFLFEDSLKEVKRKLYTELDLKTGLTGNPKLD
ncbi:hypothetical protein [Bacillus mycoides]|uniref:hypothetical protein n=1 Tax=Bacillus mycoides TaxID=1405 RepID=UPI001C01342F|nr:hypothetical protein [Bacillus mycoides]QWH95531.1 hypothetical protein EXW36_02720 [Bacillus mycoides]